MKKVGLLVFVMLSLSCAQQRLELDAPIVWLEPFDEDVAALLANETLVYIIDGKAHTVSAGWLGDSVLECGGSIFGNFQGRLARPESDLFGPEIATNHHPVCLESSYIAALSNEGLMFVLDSDLNEVARAPVNALPDTEFILADMSGDGRQDIILLTEPTERYAHGVLGDSLEAASVSVFNSETLEPIASYTLAEPFVFEQRRITPFDLGNKEGLLATRSSNQTGAGVVLLSLEGDVLKLTAEAQPIGTGFRWLNLFASRDGRAYAVRTPHIGGPLQRYTLKGDKLEIESFQLGVTNHALGSRNLDLGILLPELEPGVDHLVLPTSPLRALRLIRCDAESCDVVDELELGGRLSSNLTFIQSGGNLQIIAATGKGIIVWTPEP